MQLKCAVYACERVYTNTVQEACHYLGLENSLGMGGIRLIRVIVLPSSSAQKCFEMQCTHHRLLARDALRMVQVIFGVFFLFKYNDYNISAP